MNYNVYTSFVDKFYDDLVYGLPLDFAMEKMSKNKLNKKTGKEGRLKRSGFKYMTVHLHQQNCNDRKYLVTEIISSRRIIFKY